MPIEREQIDKLAHCIMGATDCEFNLEQSRRMVTLVFAAMDFLAAREAHNEHKPDTPAIRNGWRNTLMELYDAAKARHNGHSLGIYSDVITLLDYLEQIEEPPPAFDLFGECDALAAKLRTV